MVQWSEEWMEQLIAEAEKGAPVPIPANMKESVMQYVERKQRITNVRCGLYYHLRLCAAACMALVILAGTAAGLQRQEQVWLQESDRIGEVYENLPETILEEEKVTADSMLGQISRQMDAFASVLNEKMNAIVCLDSPDDQGGR